MKRIGCVALCFAVALSFDCPLEARNWWRGKVANPVAKFLGLQGPAESVLAGRSKRRRLDKAVYSRMFEKSFRQLKTDIPLVSVDAASGPGDLLRIAVVKSDGSVVEMNSELDGWLGPLPGKASTISVSGDGSLWRVKAKSIAAYDRIKKQWNQTTDGLGAGLEPFWTPVEKQIFSEVSVGGKGIVWAFGDDLSIWNYKFGEWAQQPGEARSISVGGDGTVCRLGKELTDDGGKIYIWSEKNKDWQKIYDHGQVYDETISPLYQISVGSKRHVAILDYKGSVWTSEVDAVDSMNVEWKNVGIGGDGEIARISITSNGTLVVLMIDGSLFVREGEAIVAKRKLRKAEEELRIKNEAEKAAQYGISQLLGLGFKKVSSIYSFQKFSAVYDEVDRTHRILATQKDGVVFELNKSRTVWAKLEQKFDDLSVSQDSMWVLMDNAVYIKPKNESVWQKISGLPGRAEHGNILADQDREAWFLAANLTLWRYESRIWKQIPGRALSLSVGEDGVAARLGKDVKNGGVVFVWDPYFGGWNRIYEHEMVFEKTGAALSRVSIGSLERMALLDVAGNVWVCGGGKVDSVDVKWRDLGTTNVVDVCMLLDGTCIVLNNKGEMFLREAGIVPLYDAEVRRVEPKRSDKIDSEVLEKKRVAASKTLSDTSKSTNKVLPAGLDK